MERDPYLKERHRKNYDKNYGRNFVYDNINPVASPAKLSTTLDSLTIS